MRNIIAAFFCLCTWVSCCAMSSRPLAATDGLQVELSRSRDSVRVVVINMSPHDVRVNTRLANGPDFGLWELYFDIRDKRGQTKEYSMKVEPNPPKETDWQDLRPHNFIGTQISFELLGLEYDLDKGVYDITANYRLTSPDGHVLQSFRSNTVQIVIESARSEHADKLKKSGEAVELDIKAVQKKQHQRAKLNR